MSAEEAEATAPQTATDAAAQRRALRSELLRRERKIRGLSNPQMGALAGINGVTFSKAANDRHVHEDTWVVIGDGLGWGAFLDYVMGGNVAAISRCDGVRSSIQTYATERLLEINAGDS